jgi:hypothetical protein
VSKGAVSEGAARATRERVEHRREHETLPHQRANRSYAVTPAGSPLELEPDPVVEAFKRNVDRTLLRANHACSADQRLRNLIELQCFAEEVRRAACGNRDARRTTDLEGLLQRLAAGRVHHIVVGGVAAVAHGGSRLTQKLDIVYSRDEDNLEKLVSALGPTAPYLRGAAPGLPFGFDVATLRRGLNFELSTGLGDIDLLGEVAGGGSYDGLASHTTLFPVFGVTCRFLNLAWLIRITRAAGRAPDLEVVAELETLLELGNAAPA